MTIEAGNVVWNVIADNKKLNAGLRSAQSQIRALGLSMTAVGGTIVGALGVAAKGAIGFRGSMAEVATLGVSDLGGLSDAVMDVSKLYGIDLTDAAKGAYQAISAGAKEAETPKLLESAARAAIGGVSDLTTAIELGTSVTNAYGGSISDVSKIYDQAFVAVKQGVTTFGELSESVGKLSPTFQAVGLKSDEMFASIAALTKGGLSTSEAVTYLNAAVTGFIRQGEGAVLQSDGLSGALKWLQEQTQGNQQQQLEFLGSTEGLKAMLALTGAQADSYTTTLEQMRVKTGQADEAFQTIKDNDPGLAWRQLQVELQALAVQIGDGLLPVLQRLVPPLISFVGRISEFIEAHPKLSEGLVLGAAGFGSLAMAAGSAGFALSGIVGGLTVLGGTGAGGFSVVALGAAAVTKAFSPMTIGVAAAGVAVWKVTDALKALHEAQAKATEATKQMDTQSKSLADQLAAEGVVLDKQKLGLLDSAHASDALFYVSQKLFALQEQGYSTTDEAAQRAYRTIIDGAIESQQANEQAGERSRSAWQWLWDTIGLPIRMTYDPQVRQQAGRFWTGQYADGGIVPRGQLALVGERGPELVRLPGGSQVYDNAETRGMLGGGMTINVTVQGGTTDPAELARQVGYRVGQELRLAGRA